jgi:predicted Ser/Thr protein kinase
MRIIEGRIIEGRMQAGLAISERWKRVYVIAQKLLDTAPVERATLAKLECGDDSSLLASVWDLVRHSAEPGAETGAFLDFSPAGGSAHEICPGRRIGPWRVVRELGRGGMGQVLLAERDDGQYTRRVALKLVNGFAIGELRERLLRERQILASLDHPGMARLLDGGETEDGAPYFVMEYVEGVPLDRYRIVEKPPFEARLRMFIEICGAVEFAHSQLVVHRDLKPGNILITPDGTPKLLDFGIAKLLGADGGIQELTIAGLGQMTPAYASPEQINGGRLTTATDVYSLGVVLYEFLTGQLPYLVKGVPLLEALRIIAETEPRPAGNLLREARGDLEAVLAKALEKDPARRYSTVQDFRRDVERFLACRPVHARPAGWVYKAYKQIRRNFWQYAAALLIAAAVAAGSIATLVQNRRANQRADEVRDLSNRILSGYVSSLADLPGTTALRRRMADDGSRFLDGLSADAPASDKLSREVARACGILADVQGAGPRHVGDFTGARRSIDRAVAIRESLVERKPGDPSLRFELADDLRRRSAIAVATQDPNHDAITARAVSAFAKLPPDWQSKREVMESLIGALGHRAWSLSSLDRNEEALATERQRLALSEKVMASSPGSLPAVVLVGDGHVRLSVYLYAQERYRESVVEAQKGVDTLLGGQKLLDTTRPADRARYRYILAGAFKAVGKPEVLLGQWIPAAQALAKSAGGCKSLVAEDGAERRSSNCLEESLLWEARALQLAGQSKQAQIVSQSYVTAALAAFYATPPNEDADPFDTDLWGQATEWGLPLSPEGVHVIRDGLPMSSHRLNLPRWTRWRTLSARWLAAEGRQRASAMATHRSPAKN